MIYADGLQIINQGNALFSYFTHLNIVSFLCNLLMFFVVLAIQNNIKASIKATKRVKLQKRKFIVTEGSGFVGQFLIKRLSSLLIY